MFFIKKNILNLNRIKGGSHRIKKDNQIFLDRNERIMPHNSLVIKNLKKIIVDNKLGFYPNFENFYKKLSKWLKISENNLLLTDGLDGSIRNMFRCFTKEKYSNIIVPHPSFAMYDVYAKLFNVKIKKINYDKDNELKYNSIFKLIDSKTSIIFIPNPNMPIEGFLTLNKIEKLAKICDNKKIILFIDEVYFHFNNGSAIKLINKYKNLIIARSFSKAFGLASIRLGYLISNKNNVQYISNSRSGYETNMLSVSVASYFIDNFDIVTKYVKDIKDGIDFLKKELDKNKIPFTGGVYGNYIFIKLDSIEQVKYINQHLIKKNIYIRIKWPKPYQNHICVSGSIKKNMKLFLKEFLISKNYFK